MLRKFVVCGVVVLSLFAEGRNALAQNAPAKTELIVSAAASLKEALTEVRARYQAQRPNVIVRFNFGSSGALQKQIERGAPVDVFVSAADKNMNELAAQNLIETSSRRVIARNRLVLVVPTSSTRSGGTSRSTSASRSVSNRNIVRSFRDLARNDVRNVAIGAPQSVPAGKYAQQVLANIGVWPRVLPKAVQGKDVRAVLTQVALGNVDAGIVYRSDAATSNQVRVVAVAPANLHAPIRYPAAVTSSSRVKAQAQLFVSYLSSPAARNILRRLKFEMP